VQVPDEQLPVVHPIRSRLPSRAARRKPRARVRQRRLPNCGRPARRETDTMDTFVDSSWYFYRYTGRKETPTAPFVRKSSSTGSPSTKYIGGVEHAISASSYSASDEGDARPGADRQRRAGRRLFTQGMVIKDGAKMSKSKGT